jgi:dTDP-4-dehydrorhamnose 3,5-epimerase
VAIQRARFLKANSFYDDRGWIRNVNASDFVDINPSRFVHNFVAVSRKNTLRGFHFQEAPCSQEKIVHVLHGQILDVSFSLEDMSTPPRFFEEKLGQGMPNDTAILSAHLAHAYFVISESATLLYLNSAPYSPTLARVINPLDADINYVWGVGESDLFLSDRDCAGMSLAEYRARK